MKHDFAELRLDRVTRRFAGAGGKAFNALDELTLTVKRGEFIALLGPSGCGKSTALNCIAGLLGLSGGSIWLDQTRIDTLPPEKRGFGMVFQNYALFPHMTVERNVGFGLRMQGVSASESAPRVAKALKMVQLTGQEHKLPGQLSGGQQQRVAIARAIVIEPPLVLMDEPLSNLDTKLRIEMRAEIRRIHGKLERATIYVTHDQDEALSMADRIVVMNAGRIEQVGTPREVYEAPATPFVADFVGKINVLPAVTEGGRRCRVGALSLAVSGDDLPAGSAVKLYLRPEDVGVHVNGAAPQGAWPARVSRIEFLGAFCHVVLALDSTDALPVVANVPRQAVDSARLAPGLAVSVSLPAAALRVLS